MMKTRYTRAALAATALLLGTALSGCGAGAVPQADVEDSITEELVNGDGTNDASTSCPDDLTAEVDSSMTCDVTHPSGDFEVKVTVTSVKDDEALYDVEIVEIVE